MQDEKRIQKLEDENKKLRKTIENLLRRLAVSEKRLNHAYHTARSTENRLNYMHSQLERLQARIDRLERGGY